ncbi:Holliday junction branch migration protein RuvA [Niabella terrae]
MIAYLKGRFASMSASTVVVDVQGVGYELHISLNTYTQIQGRESGLLYTHLLIREDAHLLYGFADQKERSVFLLLLGVSGIGANTARLILSYMKPDELSAAILSGNAQALERIKGIGKKTAERAVLELKDKISKSSSEHLPLPVSGFDRTRQDALEALQALGINRQLAEQRVTLYLKESSEMPLEDLIKKVLKGL